MVGLSAVLILKPFLSKWLSAGVGRTPMAELLALAQ
jgi:hypothetical protein